MFQLSKMGKPKRVGGQSKPSFQPAGTAPRVRVQSIFCQPAIKSGEGKKCWKLFSDGGKCLQTSEKLLEKLWLWCDRWGARCDRLFSKPSDDDGWHNSSSLRLQFLTRSAIRFAIPMLIQSRNELHKLMCKLLSQINNFSPSSAPPEQTASHSISHRSTLLNSSGQDEDNQSNLRNSSKEKRKEFSLPAFVHTEGKRNRK